MFTKTIQKLRALARVIRAADAWAKAERTLRDTQYPIPVPGGQGYFYTIDVDTETHDRIVVECDYTENELLAAVEDAQKLGVRLDKFSALS
jgi:hypothetical protein